MGATQVRRPERTTQQAPRPAGSILETVGNTPLVRLNKVTGKLTAQVYGKLEFFNPAGSVTGGRLAVFVAGLGTGRTVSGVARFLKEQNPQVRVVGIDIAGQNVVAGCEQAQEGVGGGHA